MGVLNMAKAKVWTIAYCDFTELEYQYNVRGLNVTADLMNRLQESADQRECGKCIVSLSAIGEPILESYTGDPLMASISQFVDNINEEDRPYE